jgi:hypothetical protein
MEVRHDEATGVLALVPRAAPVAVEVLDASKRVRDPRSVALTT